MRSGVIACHQRSRTAARSLVHSLTLRMQRQLCGAWRTDTVAAGPGTGPQEQTTEAGSGRRFYRHTKKCHLFIFAERYKGEQPVPRGPPGAEDQGGGVQRGFPRRRRGRDWRREESSPDEGELGKKGPPGRGAAGAKAQWQMEAW